MPALEATNYPGDLVNLAYSRQDQNDQDQPYDLYQAQHHGHFSGLAMADSPAEKLSALLFPRDHPAYTIHFLSMGEKPLTKYIL